MVMDMKNQLTAAAIAVVVCLVTSAGAGDDKKPFKRPSYRARYVSLPIQLDGKLSEKAWRSAPAVGAFHFPWWKKGKKKQTIAKILWDDKHLYIGHVCFDEHITARYTKHDEPVAKDDCFEIMIAPDPSRPNFYFNIEWNVRGAYIDGHRANGPKKPSVKWDAKGIKIAGTYSGTLNKATDIDRSWTCEVAIPLSNFSKAMKQQKPRHGGQWNINLNRHGGDVNLQYSQWSPGDTSRPSFHTPHRFGRLIFHKKKP